MPEFDIAWQRNDIVLKRIAEALRGGLLRRFGLTFPDIVEGLPGELPVLEVRSQRVDLLFRLADGSILHLEFQSTLGPDDLARFCAYNLAVYLRHRQQVWTVIFYGPDVHSAPDVLEVGSLTFRVQNVFLGREDGTQTLHAMLTKVRRGEALTDDDRAALMLLPLMRQSASLIEVLPEIAEVAQALPVEQRIPTVGALVALAWRYVDEEWAQALMEVLNMPNLLDTMIDEAIMRGLAEGKIEGKIEGKREALRQVVQARFQAIPEGLEQRIAAADLDTLNALIARAAVVERVEEL